MNLNPRENKKLSYILNFVISVICIFVLPSYILTSYPYYLTLLGL